MGAIPTEQAFSEWQTNVQPSIQMILKRTHAFCRIISMAFNLIEFRFLFFFFVVVVGRFYGAAELTLYCERNVILQQSYRAWICTPTEKTRACDGSYDNRFFFHLLVTMNIYNFLSLYGIWRLRLFFLVNYCGMKSK